MVASASAVHEDLRMKVLIAVDGSDCSASAVDSIVGRAWSPDTEFLVLSVNEPVYYEYAIPSSSSYIEQLTKARQEFNDYLSQLVESVAAKLKEKLSVVAQTKVLEGQIAESIVDCANDWHADLIVVGSHGRRGVQKFILGSVAEKVAAHAACSVEIVKRKPATG